eukprot:TRINITY_DN82309_c0_g1_i1.p1 TRINITY_DN82309_c0_g1~~TRINITY_DN82309_c0_g1_i1.p1  ORF type:complete len:272 (-),score=34.83 TRINITY_DN82309_c0_g1_i1:64-879(-)
MAEFRSSPSRSGQLRGDTAPSPPPGRAAVYSILGANLGIFGLWQLATRPNAPRPRLYEALRKHAQCSMLNLRQGRLHMLLVSSMSHRYPGHLAINAYGLAVFGNLAAERLSAPEVAAVVAGCGVASSLAHLVCHPYNAVFGASGALMGLVVVGASLQPERNFQMILPVPGLKLSMLQVADLALIVNLAGFVAGRGRLATVAWAAHLGGTAAGFAVSVAGGWLGDSRFGNLLTLHSERFESDWERTAESAEAGIFKLADLLVGRDEPRRRSE